MVESIKNKIKKLSEATGISEDLLKHVFHFEEKDIILLCVVTGNNEREKQLKTTLAILTAYHFCYEKDEIRSKELIEKLKYLGIGSLVNLSTNLKNYKQFIIAVGKQGSSAFSYKITYPGIKKGLSIINEFAGEDSLPQTKKETPLMNLHYFESNKPYTSKKILSQEILGTLKGEIKYVDPYCGDRTLHLLKSAEKNHVKILTNTKNLGGNEKQFLHDLKDFRKENPTLNFEIRNYSSRDLHDRYIISPDSLVLIGHSIKDLGNKESFAIKIGKVVNEVVYNDLNDNFNNRWNSANPI